MPPKSRREELVEAALRLFLRDGFHATGIAAVLVAADVSKMTLYHHFQSKEELIQAALELRDRRFRDWLFTRMRGWAARRAPRCWRCSTPWASGSGARR